MADKLCHCSERVVASLMAEDDEPLEYASELEPRVQASPEGAHSSRKPSEYFEPRVGVEVPLQVVGEVTQEVEAKEEPETNRDVEGSPALSLVEEEQAPQCACTQHPPQLAEDVVMQLADVSPDLIPALEEVPPSYLVSRQRCTRRSGLILSRFRKLSGPLHPTLSNLSAPSDGLLVPN